MNFNDNKPIFLQISDLICKRVLDEIYLPEERIPSVRELAVEVEVNPNTVMRSFERLQQNGIIYNKRGVGYFISSTAKAEIHKQRHATFLQEDLPELFKEMDLLGIGFENLHKAYTIYQSNKKNHENK
ncbi:GntR family transcriptional regulator [Massilibacteroides sp.]|uniref:GntR family transcriptional regulator n=1 Tax=Massilibacteroides sp. TaxID=2034766 RepID=UPI002623030F|nr:GntR family transcriptional regulator [Massilibacteroides sp.]MDD4515699.1 GntR family transcriptional regulator [Massilibacteroides sp.]